MNRYFETADPKWFGGTSLAIAYTSDINAVSPNDMTVISVNQASVWEREINYQIPAGLPPCPPEGCICSWNWIHRAHNGEGYPFEIVRASGQRSKLGLTSSTISYTDVACLARPTVRMLCNAVPCLVIARPTRLIASKGQRLGCTSTSAREWHSNRGDHIADVKWKQPPSSRHSA